MFVDASCFCAIVLNEADGSAILKRLDGLHRKLSSPTAIWETVVAVARERRAPVADIEALILRLCRDLEIDIVAIPPEAAALAVDAFARFGKGRHPAGLNFGDCFAYACARHYRVPLLYKGDDFAATDIEAA